MLKKLFIPPSLLFMSLTAMALCCFLLPEYNYFPYPYNFGGILISFLGFILMGKVHDLFKKYKTTVTIKESSSIIIEGPFSVSRNPMYIAMFILLLGAGISFMSLFSMIIPFFFLIIVDLAFVRKEEKMLEQTFGEEYLLYKKKVRRWL